ncbi:Eco57I restriction-modification methylase domain-containing protein [Amycolatopsis sp. lyj-23]|uniref:Eco57I restriction-modification methylase domain-containing protein n=1 Tax=Amycolatopsis sp. lyj-23 TaxID=2789283 RepID=UPI00397AF39B
MYDSVHNVGDFLSPHWLSEAFPGKLKTLTKEWRERAEHGKQNPLRGLSGISGRYLHAKAALPRPREEGYAAAVTGLHALLLEALGFAVASTTLETEQSETPVSVRLLSRVQAPAGEALHVLQAAPVDDIDDLFGEDGWLLDPMKVHNGKEKIESIASVTKAVRQLFLTEHAPRFVLVLAGGWLVLSDVERWAEGRYLALDVDTALSRKDDKAAGELAWHAGLVSADVLLPVDGGASLQNEYAEDSIKHAVGVSEDLREGLRISVELIANEVIAQRRANGDPVEGIPELPRELTTQSLRFLYRILFLLYAEARPELAILPVGAPEYDAGYGLDRLRDLIQRPLTGRSRDGHHLHDSLRLLFRLVNQGHGAGTAKEDGLVFEPLRADLFDRQHAYHIDNVNLSNAVLQQVLALLLLSKPSKSKGARRGYVSYAQLGINQLGAVYEGLMAYSGFIAERELVELAKDGANPAKGIWLVPRENLAQYDARHVVHREDPLTGEKSQVVHPTGTFVYRLSGRDRQRSASYYTPEVLTRCVVRHSLAELISDATPAAKILEYRICEPAMGSGAFLNEAINQLAAEYLERRQAELEQRIDPEDYRDELQKVKAYLALHRCYGVDLNDTARELAEVSLWLNVMHRGLKAPWFGLHLKRGNSLIGARRATYDLTALGRAKQSWLTTPPIDRPLIDGAVPEGEIHHFLLPAAGWGAVKDAKQAKELAPEQVERLKDWAKAITRKPGKEEIVRLRGLARRVERLWKISLNRLAISEREVSRHIDVWGTSVPEESLSVSRERVESELSDPDGPFLRLRLAMDAWCALFFWPITTDVELPDLGRWITALEGLLGVSGKNKVRDQAELVEGVDGFDELATVDGLEKTYFGMRDVTSVILEHRWLGLAREIAQREGFFHWELDFAQVFADGGFDLQLGNPPWVRLDWKDDEVLAEHEPFFVLQDKIPDLTFRRRRAEVIAEPVAERQYLGELASWAGSVEHLGDEVQHPVLSGLRGNLYMSFMERAWRSMSRHGIVGLLHPESHFTDPKGGRLRAETYRRLRRHWQFINEMKLFEDVDNHTVYGVQIYGSPRVIAFRQIANLLVPDTIEGSLNHDGSGEVPGIQFPWGGWDLRPHASRIVEIAEKTLDQWVALFDEAGTPAPHARLLRPLTREQLEALATLAGQGERMTKIDYRWTGGWNEKVAKENNYIEWRTQYPSVWDEVILQGPQFSVATPFAKEPNESCRSNKDYSEWDLEELPERVIPRTNYQRATDRERYDAGLAMWNGRPYTDYYRLAWRRMVQSGHERTLQAALILPGASHVHTVHSLAAESKRGTVLLSGLWVSLAFDYLVKVSGKSDISDELIKRLPAPIDHPVAPYLLLRTLRLNCLTRDYAPLWQHLYESSFVEDSWTEPFKDWPQLGVAKREWDMETPLRSEFERRAALVEIDALVAIMLGLTADQLCLMYRGQFAVLRKYEYTMYFDNLGRKIAKEYHTHGVKQQPEDFKLLQAHFNGEDSGDLLDRYELPITPVDREAEMRAAYAEFTRRLDQQEKR